MSKMDKTSILKILILSLFLLHSCNDYLDEDFETEIKEENGFKVIEKADIRMKWRMEEEWIRIHLTAPTNGWIAVGFSPKTGMKDANIIIGFVNEDGDIEIEDHYGSDTFSHRKDTSADGRRDVIVIGGEEKEESTEIRFRIPLDSGDIRDVPLEAGKSTTIILSYGETDNINQQHVVRTITQFEL